jgi:hypothetical protein
MELGGSSSRRDRIWSVTECAFACLPSKLARTKRTATRLPTLAPHILLNKN